MLELALADEGAALVFFHDAHQRRQIMARGGKFIRVPLQIPAHPVERPLPARKLLHESRNTHTRPVARCPIPRGPLLVDRNGVAFDVIDKPKLVRVFGRRLSPAQLTNRAVDLLQLQLVERHDLISFRSLRSLVRAEGNERIAFDGRIERIDLFLDIDRAAKGRYDSAVGADVVVSLHVHCDPPGALVRRPSQN